jgi:hypothetical protein
MGVDVWIPRESLGQCQEARCRPYRPNAENRILRLSGSLRSGDKEIRQVIPIVSILSPLNVLNLGTIEAQPGTENQYALDVTAVDGRFYFNRWLTQSEYAEVESATSSPRMNLPHDSWMSLLSSEEQETICTTCPLKSDYSDDCRPRLFSYPTLPILRQAATLIFSMPPEHMKTRVQTLASDFLLIFPEAIDGENRTAKQEDSFRAIDNRLKAEGYDHSLVEEIPPTGRYNNAIVGDIILNGLFFREVHPDDPNAEQEWREGFMLSGTRLEKLVDWLRQLLVIIDEISSQNGHRESLNRFKEVIQIYYTSCKTALQYNLEISVSW